MSLFLWRGKMWIKIAAQVQKSPSNLTNFLLVFPTRGKFHSLCVPAPRGNFHFLFTLRSHFLPSHIGFHPSIVQIVYKWRQGEGEEPEKCRSRSNDTHNAKKNGRFTTEFLLHKFYKFYMLYWHLNWMIINLSRSVECVKTLTSEQRRVKDV